MEGKKQLKGIAALSAVALVSFLGAQTAAAQEVCIICEPTFPPNISRDPGDAFHKIEDAFLKLDDLFHKELPSDPFFKFNEVPDRLREDVFHKWLEPDE